MANYVLNDNGSITKSNLKKKKKKEQQSKNYILNDNGSITLDYNLKQKRINSSQKNTWFNINNFKDGYQIGDISKTIVGTAVDTIDNLARGGAGSAESALDLGLRGASGIAGALGNKKLAKDLKKTANINMVQDYNLHRLAYKNNALDNLKRVGSLVDFAKDMSKGKSIYESTTKQLKKYSNNGFNKSLDDLSKNSLSGDKLDSVVEGVGQYGGMVALQSIGIPWQVTSGVTSFNSGLQEADKNGASTGDAIKSALISAGGEIASEYLTGGLGKLTGTGAFDDAVKKKLTKNMKSLVAKNLFSFGYDMAGEGIEEVISGYIDAFGKKITYMKDKDIKDIYSNKEALNDFVAGALVSGIAGVGGAVKTTKAGRDLSTGNTANEQKIINSETQKRLDKELAKGSNKSLSERQKNILREKIENQVTKDVMNGKTSIDTIYDVLGKEQTDDIINNYRNKDTYLKNSIYNEVQKGKQFQYEKTGNLKKDTMLESLSKVGNNSIQSQEIASLGSKLIDDLNVDVEFINNNSLEDLKKKGLNIDTLEDKNGFQVGNKIYLNVDSSEYGSFVMGHEMTHILENNKEDYQVLQDTLFEYAKAKGVYEEDLNNLKETYSNIENADVLKELSANYVGNFFTDEQFVNNLTTKNPNLVVRIYNSLKTLYYKATGQKEKLAYQQALNTIQKVYRNYSQSIQGQYGNDVLPVKQEIQGLEPIDENKVIKYMTIGKKGAKNLEKNSDSRYYKNLNNRKKIAEDIHNNSQDTLDNTNIKSKNETQWFKTKYGDWGTIISDKDSKLIKKLEPNKTYKLSDILDHDLLYKAYPELKKLKVITSDINTTGAYSNVSFLPANTLTNEIYLKNADINKKDFRNTLLHEINHYIQHKENYNKESRGDTSKISKEKHDNNLGEIISNETKINSNLTQEELDNIMLPEQSKQNPKFDNIKDKLKQSNKNDKKGAGNNAIQNLESSIQDKIQNSKVDNKQNNNSSRMIEDNEELDNSSFSNDKIQYSISNKDSKGRTLSKEQQEYFKDSKAVDENGNLKELYHGTPNDFTKFNYDKLGTNGTLLGKGFYLTDDINVSEAYANKSDNGKVMKLYADIKKPLKWGETSISKNQYKDFVEAINEATNGTLFADYSGEYSEKGSELYNDTLNDILMDYEYGGDDIDLISGILNSTGMSWDKGYKILKDTTGYDGIIVTKDVYDSGEGNVYIPFLPNQIKNVDNIKPTENDDIRYSKGNLEDNNSLLPIYNQNKLSDSKIKEVDSRINNEFGNDILPFKQPIPGDPTKAETYEERDTLPTRLKEKAINETIQNALKNKSYSAINEATREGHNYFNFSQQERQRFKEDLSKYLGKTKEDITNPETQQEIKDIISNYAVREMNYVDEEVKNIKKQIRDTKIYVPNEIQNQITDYNYFKKSNFGNLKLSKEGTSIDVLWQELSDAYPYYFDKEINGESDMLYELSDFMQKDIVNKEKYKLTDSELDTITTKVFNKLIHNTLSENDLIDLKTTLDEKLDQRISRHEVIQKNRNLAKDKIGNILGIKDKKMGIMYQINTMKRNLRDTMSPEQAQSLYETYFEPIKKHNAEIEKEITNYNERIAKYNLNEQESVYTQMLGELKYSPDTTLSVNEVEKYLKDNKKKINQSKVNDAIQEFRNIYDETRERFNGALIANGYNPVEYRKGYFPHFIEDKAQSIIGKMAEKMGWKIQDGTLPTTILGITDTFRPGRVWTSFSQQRTGDATDYNALKGFDNYIRGAMELMYHTEDIQKLRALENEIRYQYSDKGIKEKINEIYNDVNLDAQEKYDKVSELTSSIRDNPLGNLATEIKNYTDNLANKKAFGDRSMEQDFGRKMYSVMTNVSNRVSANMVGMNISSAITNFIPITQAWGQTSTKNLMRGILESIKNNVSDDGFADSSVFLTNRTKQADRLYKTKVEKINDKLGILFEGIDSFTANAIVRGKYYDNIEKGMSEVEAMRNADEFANDLMGGRSKGDNPTIFNKKNPLVKLFTAFQLEVNNQYGYMFKDVPRDLEDESKTKLISAFIKMFFGAWLYNQLSEKITGRKSAFSPIDMAMEGYDTWRDEKLDISEKISNTVENIGQELPFVGGLLGGGRLPIQSALPYSGTYNKNLFNGTIQDIQGLFDDEKRETAINELLKEWSKPVYFVALPFAGGQLKKTIEGASMYKDLNPFSDDFLQDRDIAGSYNNNGGLRFEADKSPLGKAQSLIFGQYAGKNARDYFSNGDKTLTKDEVNKFKDTKMNVNDYRKYKENIKDLSTEEKFDYISELPYDDKTKNKLINNAVKRKNKIDISNYNEYGDYEEFYYATTNPDKYNLITSITDFDSYQQIDEDIKGITGKNRKSNVQRYINSLDLSRIQKIMLFKKYYNSYDTYNNQIIDYVRNLDKTNEEKENILKQYGFTISDGKVRW